MFWLLQSNCTSPFSRSMFKQQNRVTSANLTAPHLTLPATLGACYIAFREAVHSEYSGLECSCICS